MKDFLVNLKYSYGISLSLLIFLIIFFFSYIILIILGIKEYLKNHKMCKKYKEQIKKSFKYYDDFNC